MKNALERLFDQLSPQNQVAVMTTLGLVAVYLLLSFFLERNRESRLKAAATEKPLGPGRLETEFIQQIITETVRGVVGALTNYLSQERAQLSQALSAEIRDLVKQLNEVARNFGQQISGAVVDLKGAQEKNHGGISATFKDAHEALGHLAKLEELISAWRSDLKVSLDGFEQATAAIRDLGTTLGAKISTNHDQALARMAEIISLLDGLPVNLVTNIEPVVSKTIQEALNQLVEPKNNPDLKKLPRDKIAEGIREAGVPPEDRAAIEAALGSAEAVSSPPDIGQVAKNLGADILGHGGDPELDSPLELEDEAPGSTDPAAGSQGPKNGE